LDSCKSMCAFYFASILNSMGRRRSRGCSCMLACVEVADSSNMDIVTKILSA
jgi:hypothetical protein